MLLNNHRWISNPVFCIAVAKLRQWTNLSVANSDYFKEAWFDAVSVFMIIIVWESKKCFLDDKLHFNAHCSTGEPGVYCWSTQIKSGSGERLQNTYIVLPVDKASDLEASLRLQPTFPHQHEELKAQSGLTVVSENCGLRFDVTGPFASSMTWPKFCVKIMPLRNSVVNDLKCSPFLVTIWLREHHSPT